MYRSARTAAPECPPAYAVDLTDQAALTAAITSANPEVVVNCAGLTAVDSCEQNPDAAYAINTAAVATIASSCRKLGAHFVHVSTDYVFDGLKGPYAPDALPNPRGVYAITKHAGEQVVRALAAPGAYSICRTAVVFGAPKARYDNFGTWLFRKLATAQAATLFEDQWVTPTHARNAGEMIAEIALRRLSGVWHTAGATTVSRLEFGEALCKRLHIPTYLLQPTKLADAHLASPRPSKSALDVSATASMLQARPWELPKMLDIFAKELAQ